MQIEVGSKKRTRNNNNDASTHEQSPNKSRQPNKDLLRLQNPIYQLKKSQEDDSQYVIRKLINRRDKPTIGKVERSPLLSRLAEMMPTFHKSNEELASRVITQHQKIDAQLQQCSSSSDSQDSDDESNQVEKVESKVREMEIENTQKPKKKPKQKTKDFMVQQSQSTPTELEINFLRYPYLTPEQAEKLQKQKQDKKPIQTRKKVLVEQMKEENSRGLQE